MLTVSFSGTLDFGNVEHSLMNNLFWTDGRRGEPYTRPIRLSVMADIHSIEENIREARQLFTLFVYLRHRQQSKLIKYHSFIVSKTFLCIHRQKAEKSRPNLVGVQSPIFCGHFRQTLRKTSETRRVFNELRIFLSQVRGVVKSIVFIFSRKTKISNNF